MTHCKLNLRAPRKIIRSIFKTCILYVGVKFIGQTSKVSTLLNLKFLIVLFFCRVDIVETAELTMNIVG